MSKHRRPTRVSRLGHGANSPLQLSIAAGVAGTLSLTGTVVASASDSSTVTTLGATSAGTAEIGAPSAVRPVAGLTGDTGDLTRSAAQVALRVAVVAAHEKRVAALAEARAREVAQRKAAHARAVRKQAEAKLARVRQARQARTMAKASRSVERMSASAANALDLAAAAASGASYAYGATGPSAFDCSGFTAYVFAKMGISLPHSSSAQRGMVQSVSTPQPGDLVFVYNGGGGSIGHVGIYAGGGYWWEASNPSAGVGKHRAWSSAVSYGRVL